MRFLLILLIVSGGFYSSFAQAPCTLDSTYFTFGGFPGYTVSDVGVQTDGKIIVVGGFRRYGLDSIAGIARLNSDGTLDKTFNVGGKGSSSIDKVAILSDGRMMIIGSFMTSYNGVICGGIARLNADGSLDPTFNQGTGFTNTGPHAMTIQSDGKIIVAGQSGFYKSTAITAVSRINTDGTLDNTFNCTMSSIILPNAVVVQSDGKVVVGGSFTTYNSTQTLKYIFRLNADGSRDNSYVPVFNSTVEDMLLQEDGKIIVGGGFNNTNHVSIARLNSDGSFDNTFQAGTNINGGVKALLKQTDGKIVAAGTFRNFQGVDADRIVRLTSDGAVDNSFVSGKSFSIDWIGSIAFQTDGSIIAVGNLFDYQNISAKAIVRIKTNGSIDYSFNKGATVPLKIILDNQGKALINCSYYSDGEVVKQLLRLNTDGSVDRTFSVTLSDYSIFIYATTITSMIVQPDDKIIIAGQFTSVNGTAVQRICRLNPDGSLDPTFQAQILLNEYVNSMALQTDGKIIVGGHFSSINGIAIGSLARLNSDGSLDIAFSTKPGASFINKVFILPNGKILVGGGFDVPDFTYSIYIGRFNSDGSFDNSFVPDNFHLGSDVNDFAVQKDGKIVLVTSYGNFGKVKRLNIDGTNDYTFRIGSGANSRISTCLIQEDGKIIIGGDFTVFNGQAAARLARLNTDGSLDASFYPSGYRATPDAIVNDLVIQKDGKIIVVGAFDYVYNSVPVNHIYRINGDPIHYNSIKGNVYTDSNADCILQSHETRLPSMIIQAQSNDAVFYGGSDAYGKYEIRVDSGTVAYSLSQQKNSGVGAFVIDQCATSSIVNLTGAAKEICCYDFADTITNCSLLSVEITTSRLRRCSRNSAIATYSNFGSKSADGVVVKVVFPAYVVPIKTIPTWSDRSGDTLIYNIGHLAAGQSETIVIIDSVVCGLEKIRGLTQCFQAFISPASSCFIENPLWDKSSVQVQGVCINSKAHFEINNSGIAAMTEDSEFRVFENDTLIYKSNFKLALGEKLMVDYPALGSTIRLEADQSVHHPGMSIPRAAVEACGATNFNAVKGLITTHQQDDLDEGKSIDCQTIVDSFDPNDKTPMPLGVGLDHMIEAGQRIKYSIRFQNTGTDTAYTVRVIDTLDTNVDISSFSESASSHPYRLEISGKDKAVLTFNFDYIKLVDSTRNEAASHGFVSFYLNTKAGLANGTGVKNKAGIYFDYNSPVITNTTSHIIGTYTASDLTKGNEVQVTNGTLLSVEHPSSNQAVVVFPNPASDVVQVKLTQELNDAKIILLDLSGHEVYSGALKGEITSVSLAGLSSGMYLYKVQSNGEFIGVGKLVVK